MTTTSARSSFFQLCRSTFLAVLIVASALHAQVVTVTIQGRVYDTTGAAISQANVSVTNTATGFARSATASATGEYQIAGLPVGDYTITAEKAGFQKQAKKVHLDIGASGNIDFDLAVGQVSQEVNVQDVGEVAEPTRTMVSSVIDEQKIEIAPEHLLVELPDDTGENRAAPDHRRVFFVRKQIRTHDFDRAA